MTSIAKAVPCRFDVYWRTMFPKSRFCRVLNGGHFGREFMNGCFTPVGTAASNFYGSHETAKPDQIARSKPR